MKSAAMPYLSGRITAGALMSVLLIVLIPVLPLHARQLDSSAALERTKSKAETQHEIVMLLIKKREYRKAAREANKIFEMKWPENQETERLLLRSLLLISDGLLQQGQPSLGLQVLEKNSKCFKQTRSRIAILKEQGYIYKTMNQNDKAYDCFQKAIELENKN